MSDTEQSETGKTEALENEVKTEAPATGNATDTAEVERLRKEKEQAEMRARQLQNQLDAKAKEEEEAKAKELEKNQEFKTLAEQEKAKREELEARIAEEERQKELKELSDKTLADYSNETRELAKELGLNLSDTSDEAVTEFKAKLDAAQARVGGQKVTANNGNQPTTTGEEPTGADLFVILNDPVKRDEYYRKYKPLTASMMSDPQK